MFNAGRRLQLYLLTQLIKYISAILREKQDILNGLDKSEEIATSETPNDVPPKIIKQVLLTPGKIISMSILLNQKSTFHKQNGLSGKPLMEKVLVEIPKLALGEVETYNISKNKTKVLTTLVIQNYTNLTR